MHELIFVTPDNTKDFDLWVKKSYPDIAIIERVVLKEDKAIKWIIPSQINKNVLDKIRKEFKIDVFQKPKSNNKIKLFLADMDSTIISGESLDDMANMIGKGGEISKITARAMRGELDFEQALETRISMLKDMSDDIIKSALKEVKINKGAIELLKHLKSKDIYCVLVSGGFTQFTSFVADKLDFDAHFGNELIIENNKLTGKVKYPILDKNFKAKKLSELTQSMNISPTQTMAIGDGANDLPMLETADIGVGYYSKPILKDTLINRIEYTDLSSLIYMSE